MEICFYRVAFPSRRCFAFLNVYYKFVGLLWSNDSKFLISLTIFGIHTSKTGLSLTFITSDVSSKRQAIKQLLSGKCQSGITSTAKELNGVNVS